MILVLAYIVNLLAPIVNMIGLFGIFGCISYGDFYILGIAMSFAIAGLVFGIFAHRNDIPPRWSWSKSKNELFSFSVTAVLGYAVNFAMWPFALYLIGVIVEKI